MRSALVHRSRPAALLAAAIITLACTVREERPADTADTADSPRGGLATGDTSRRAPTRVLTIEGLQTPESVLHDRELDVYFISNINGNPSQKDGNGFISRVRPDGTIDSLRFIAGGRGGATLNAPKGMTVRGDTLWVSDIDVARAFDKRTGAPITSVSFAAQNPGFLNDMAAGPDGAIYITDSGFRIATDGSMSATGTDRVMRIGPDGRAITVIASGDSLMRPNGITWDQANNRLIIVAFQGPAIRTWTPGTEGTTVLASGPGQFDGVEIIGDGRMLVSSWADSSVHLFADGRFERAIAGVNGPADIGWDAQRNRVLIPLFSDNRVEVWELGSGSR